MYTQEDEDNNIRRKKVVTEQDVFLTVILAVVSSDGYRRFHVFAMVASSSPALRGISLGVTAKILQILGDPSTGGVVFKNSRNFMVQI